VIEPAFGVERTVLAVLLSAYNEETVNPSTGSGQGEERVVMKFPYWLAPIKVAVLPLMKKDGMAEKAQEVFDNLKTEFESDMDTSGSIGKRYRRQDEIGTPFCITIDHDTLKDESVTVRDRDSLEQERIKIDELESYLGAKLR